MSAAIANVLEAVQLTWWGVGGVNLAINVTRIAGKTIIKFLMLAGFFLTKETWWSICGWINGKSWK